MAEALGLNDKKKKDEEPVEIEEEVDIESLEMGKTKKMIIYDMPLKFFFVFIIFNSCENFKRFGQEKYTCI